MNVAGGGMAGLAAAARARELGAAPVVWERAGAPGGSMRLSSCVVWRYREWDEFRRQCPAGDESLQRLVWERLDDALAWLRALGATPVWEDTPNPLTTGQRFDPEQLTAVLVDAAGGVRCGETCSEPDVAATGGFQGDARLVARFVSPSAPLPLRANAWSRGDGLRLGLARGAALSAGMDEFYGRNMSDGAWDAAGFVPLAQLYGLRAAAVLDVHGHEVEVDRADWSETRLVQRTARLPEAAAWYVLGDDALADPDVARRVERARESGGTVVDAATLPFDVPAGTRTAVRVRAAITYTIGGLRVDTRARVLGETGAPVDGLLAAGADVGGMSAGGYASGLAAALVLGLTAAETFCGA